MEKINELILKYENHIIYLLNKKDDDELINLLDSEEIKIFKKVLIDLYNIKNSKAADLNMSDDLDEDLYDMLKNEE